MKKYRMWIGGKWVEAASGKTYKVLNPATEEEIAEVPLGDRADVDLAVAAARQALPAWSKKSRAERSKILNQLAASINQHARELVDIDVLDHGTPVGLARMFVQSAPQSFEYAAQVSRAFTDEVIPVSPGKLFYTRREPLGVCGLIVPWNVPIAVTWKLSAALSVGNTCIVKLPTVDALTGLKLAEIFEKYDLPPGTINFVTGPGETVGEVLVSHPGVDMVFLTGSSETGKRIMNLGSQTVKRLALELGGKNPFIVLADADIDAALGKALQCSFFNTGMVCDSPGRYYIHESLYDEFVGRFVEGAKRVVVGDPGDEKTQMGPVVSAEHRNRVEGYIKIGINEGAELALGGKRPARVPLNKGYFIMPTVFKNVTQDMRIAREEIFGPVASFLKFSSEDEVVRLANDSIFGLAASVWTQDAAKGIRLANEIHAGTVWVNDHLIHEAELPWGGFKESGFGKECSILGLQEYTRVKLISVDLGEKKN